MATYLDTHFMPLDDTGSYLLVCGVTQENSSHLYRDETSHACAFSGHLDGVETTELLANFTMPRPSSAAEAKSHIKMAKNHRDLAKAGADGPAHSRYMRECAVKQEYSARIAETNQLWLPSRVAASANGVATVCLVTRREENWHPTLDKVVVRQIDCRSGTTLLEERFRGSTVGFASSAYKEYSNFLCMDRRGRSILVYEHGLTAALGSPPRIRINERSLSRGLRTISKTDPVRYSRGDLVSCGDDIWVLCGADYGERGASITIFETGTGKQLKEVKIARAPVSIALSHDGSILLCGFLGGQVWVVELETQEIRKFAPHIGAGREDWTTVQLAQSKGFFLSETREQVVLTSLVDGSSAPLGKLRHTVREGKPFDGLDTSVTIASKVSILGDRIAIAENAVVRELSAETSDYDDEFVSEAGRPGARKPVRVSRKAPIEESIAKARLETHTKTLLSYRSPAAVIKSKKLGKRGWSQPNLQHAPALGTSRLGGWPDLPAATEWPQWQGRPMAFLAQLNLAEAHVAQPEMRLPKEGLLSFFLGCTEETYANDEDPRERCLIDFLQERDASDPPGWLVTCSRASASLRRMMIETAPLPELFNPAAVRFQAGGKAFPDEQGTLMRTFGFNNAERAAYVEMIGQLQSSNHEHQLMGYPSIIQFMPPELYCAASGFDVPGDEDSEGFRELAASASEWVMLLQLFSDSKADFLWGDAGQLYFCIRREALEKLDFSETRVFYEN